MPAKKWLCLYGPVALFFLILILDKPFPEFLPGMTSSELGLTESLQAIFLFGGMILVLGILVTERNLATFLKAWIGLAFFGLTYIFLEEISYGQHYFNWDTPEYWQALNDQNETNFHNTSSWFDQKPRLLLEIGVIIGGIILPLLRRFKPGAIPQKFADIYPDSALFVVALLAIVPRIYERVVGKLNLDIPQLFNRTSEVQELYFYYFILLYLVFFAYEHRRGKSAK